MLCVYDGESRSSVYTSILGLKSVYNFKSKALKTIDSQAKWNTKNVAEDTCYKTQRVSSLFVVIFFFLPPLFSADAKMASCMCGLFHKGAVVCQCLISSVPPAVRTEAVWSRSEPVSPVSVAAPRASTSLSPLCIYIFIYYISFGWRTELSVHTVGVCFSLSRNTHTHTNFFLLMSILNLASLLIQIK